jgi:TPP-dependent pyruvate/acetoin dehydrogenase alpha subunit
MARKSKPRPQQSKKKSDSFLQPTLLTADQLKQLYSVVLRCRILAEKLQELEQQGRLDRALVPETGHEAIEAGTLTGLHPDDLVAPGTNAVAAGLVRGEPVKSIVAELLGETRRPRQKNRAPLSVLPCSLSLAAQINIALGAAWGSRSRKDRPVAISICRESSTSPSVWRDAVVFSVLHKLAVIHVVHTGRSEAAAVDGHSALRQHLSSLGSDLPTLTVDGDDAVAVYRVCQEAVRRARQGRGPALIECQTSATASVGHLKNLSVNHQPPGTDPIQRLETYLQRKGIWSERWKRGLVASFVKELDRALEKSDKSRVQLLTSGRAADSVLASAG